MLLFAVESKLRSRKLRFMKPVGTPSLNIFQTKNTLFYGATIEFLLNQNIQIVYTPALLKAHFMTAKDKDKDIDVRAVSNTLNPDLRQSLEGRKPQVGTFV